jgi:putative colanic acid biosynthesis glycosyltransferase
MNRLHRLTIVTVTKNNLAGLMSTHESLKGIEFPFDWVIKDGGSSDGTPQYVENFCNPTKYLDIPDFGIFDGMNIALRYVETDFVQFLNAGDRLVSGFELERTLKALIESEKNWLVAGALISVSGRPVDYWQTPTFPYLWRVLGLQSWCHQSTIYRSDFLAMNGAYDVENIIADWSTALALERIESPLVRVEPLSIFELGGVSGSLSRSNWIRLHTKGRSTANLLFRNSRFLDKYFISYPAYLMLKKPYLKRFLLPIFNKILKN